MPTPPVDEPIRLDRDTISLSSYAAKDEAWLPALLRDCLRVQEVHPMTQGSWQYSPDFLGPIPEARNYFSLPLDHGPG